MYRGAFQRFALNSIFDVLISRSHATSVVFIDTHTQAQTLVVFLGSLQTLSPVNRLSAHQAMQHPWLQDNLTKSMRFLSGDSNRASKQKLRGVVLKRHFVRSVHSITAISAMQRWARVARGAKESAVVQEVRSDKASQAARVAQTPSQISKVSTVEKSPSTEKVKKKGLAGFFKMFKR